MAARNFYHPARYPAAGRRFGPDTAAARTHQALLPAPEREASSPFSAGVTPSMQTSRAARPSRAQMRRCTRPRKAARTGRCGGLIPPFPTGKHESPEIRRFVWSCLLRTKETLHWCYRYDLRELEEYFIATGKAISTQEIGGAFATPPSFPKANRYCI